MQYSDGLQQHGGLGFYAFLPAQVAELFVGFALNVDRLFGQAQIGGDIGAHGGNVRGEFRLLRDNGGIDVDHAPARRLDAFIGFAQQHAAVGIFEFGGGIGEMAADVAQTSRPQQRIG